MSKKYFEKLARSSGVSSKEFKSDFGLKILKKFGWEEGKGLGLNEDGKQDCVQIKKRDTGVGLGAEKVESTNDKNWENWWADSYNNVAQKIDLGSPGKKDDSSDSSDSDDDGTVAGGGRPTSVKGARFQRGKLARVMRQERGPGALSKQNNDSDSSSDSDSDSDSDDADANVPDFLKKLREWQQKNNKNSTATSSSSSSTTTTDSSPKKKKKTAESAAPTTPTAPTTPPATVSTPSSSEKKKKKAGEDYHPHAGESCTRFATPVPESDKSEKKKKKKRSREEENTNAGNAAAAAPTEDAAPKKKKSKKDKA